MKKEILIAPSILSADFANMELGIKNIESWGGDLIHCDVMDGVYVPNITFGMPMVAAIRKITKLPLDVHLMIVEPEKYIKEFASAGADIITFHPEASSNPLQTLNQIKDEGKKAGIVINANVDINQYIHLLNFVDIVLIMSVQAGYGGQKFMPSALEKLEIARKYRETNKLTYDIEVDGGINESNVSEVKAVGANIIVAGSAVFNAQDPSSVIKKMKA